MKENEQENEQQQQQQPDVQNMRDEVITLNEGDGKQANESVPSVEVPHREGMDNTTNMMGFHSSSPSSPIESTTINTAMPGQLEGQNNDHHHDILTENSTEMNVENSVEISEEGGSGEKSSSMPNEVQMDVVNDDSVTEKN